MEQTPSVTAARDVVRQVLDGYGLLGPYPGHPMLETTVRVTPDGTRCGSCSTMRPRPVEVAASFDGWIC